MSEEEAVVKALEDSLYAYGYAYGLTLDPSIDPDAMSESLKEECPEEGLQPLRVGVLTALMDIKITIADMGRPARDEP